MCTPTKKIEIDGQTVKYIGYFTDIDIKEPKGLSMAEDVALTARIMTEQSKRND